MELDSNPTYPSETFTKAVVSSVTLSCLLSMDFVPNSKPPPVKEMVQMELPRVLSVIMRTQNLGIQLERELHAGLCSDPADLLKRVSEAVKDHRAAAQEILERGHVDSVFSTLMYTRKPPTATSRRITKYTKDVAEVLGVDVPEELDAFIGDIYESTHGMLVKV